MHHRLADVGDTTYLESLRGEALRLPVVAGLPLDPRQCRHGFTDAGREALVATMMPAARRGRSAGELVVTRRRRGDAARSVSSTLANADNPCSLASRNAASIACTLAS